MERRTFLQVTGAALGGGVRARRGWAASDHDSAALLGLLEDAPRERLPGALVGLIRDGLGFGTFLDALAQAAVRNVQPYPDVGFKYHAVMVLQSIHLTTSGLGVGDRWLPAVWAADYFKRSQAAERRATGWRMPPRRALGTDPERARRALVAALDAWDRDAADAAIVECSAHGDLGAAWELLFRYGARDLREIGHKAITVQNAHRLVALLGAAHAAPILRSAVAALQNPGGDPNPAQTDLPADRPWTANRQRLAQIPPTWQDGREDAGARTALLSALAEVPPEDAGALIVEQLRRGIAVATIWEALLGAAAELIARRPGIVAVHAQTTANALRYVYRVSRNQNTRLLALLQCAAFVAMFQRVVGAARGGVRLEALEPVALEGSPGDAIDEIFSELPERRVRAAGKTLAYLASDGDVTAWVAQSRHHLARNVRESHDYKFAEALFEDASWVVDRTWQARLLAAGTAYLRGQATTRPSEAVAEAIALLG